MKQNKIILPLNEQPSVYTCIHHAYPCAIIESKELAIISIDSFEKTSWNKLTYDTSIQVEDKRITILEEGGDNTNTILWRSCKRHDEVVLALEYIKPKDKPRYVDVFLFQNDLQEEIAREDKTCGVRWNPYGYFIEKNMYRFETRVYKYIKVGASYSFHALYKGDSAWQFRHRGRLHVTGSYSVDNWGLSLRVMPEVTYADKDVNPLEEVNPEWLMRTRLKVDYSFIDKPVKPYVSVEMFNPLKAVPNYTDWLDRMRYTVGVEWSIDAHNKFDFYYLIEHNMGQEISVVEPILTIRSNQNNLNHNIGIKYKYVF